MIAERDDGKERGLQAIDAPAGGEETVFFDV